MAQKMDLNQIVKMARETGEVFLASLSKEELERGGFDTSVFAPFRFAEVYLVSDGEKLSLRYVFDGDERRVYYEKPKDMGGEQYFIEVVETYMRMYEKKVMLEEPGTAIIRMIQAYPLGPNKGAVYIYEVMPHVDDNMRIQSFYICTFDDENTEIAWGLGSFPKEALQNAIPHWDRYANDEDDEKEENPFKKLLEELYSH